MNFFYRVIFSILLFISIGAPVKAHETIPEQVMLAGSFAVGIVPIMYSSLNA